MGTTWSKSWTKPYILFSIFFWLKFALLRVFLFGKLDLVWWLLDLAEVVVLTGLIELIFRGKAKKPAYWSLDTLLSLIFFAATLYFEHFGSVVTYTSILQMKQLMQISSSVKATIRPWDFLFFADLLIGLLLWFRGRKRANAEPPERSVWRFPAAALLIAGLIVTGWLVKTDKGITNELVRAEQLGFFDYEVSVAITGLHEKKQTKYENISDVAAAINALEASYGYSGTTAFAASGPALFASQKGKNLIVVQMEAFQNFPIHLTVDGKEITPVLNKLVDESYYFPHIFQQIGQGNTSDAEFMSNTSIYPTGTIPMSTGYGDRSLPSLPKLVEGLGYEADTFHVNVVTFWDRIKLYPALGFTHYFDKPNYVDDHFNSFGASDEELYRVGVEKLSALQQQHKPFYTQFITVSSHFPFTVPEDRKKMAAPANLAGKQLGDYIVAINYTDFALGTFIDRLKAAGLWDNTVFVAYGDHFGLQPQDNDPAQVSSDLGITYQPSITRFNIPLIIHVPGQTKGQVINQVGGQLDIMPTIANLMGISLKDMGFVHFGQDLFNIQKNVLGSRYYMPTGSFFNDDIMFIPGKGFEDGSAVSLKTLQPVSDFSSYRSDYDYILKLMELSDEYVNLLPKR